MTQKTSSLSRRRFLQLSAAGAAAAFGSVNLNLTPQQALAMRARQEAGVLRVAWGNPATLDPATASADSEISVLTSVYDYLIDTNASNELLPRLAESWEISDDGLVYTLKIREGVTFHDGSDLTLDDVMWSIDYLRENSGIGDLLDGVEVASDAEANTVSFTLANTQPDFLFNISDNRFVILKSGASDLETTFNGTGPFVVDDFAPGDRMVMSANANYWGGAPGIETLEYIFFDDQQAAISALQGGVVDVVLRMDNATFFSLASDPSFEATNIPTNGYDAARLRVDVEPGNNPLVVEAFKLATDRSAIYERIQLGFGAEGKDSPVGPLFAAYFDADLEAPARDVDRARELLAEAGYEDGLDLTFTVPNSGDRPALAQALAAQWEEAGIRTNIELQDEAEYYSGPWLEAVLGITGWGSRATPQFYLDIAFKTGGDWNETRFSDPEVDALIETAGTSVDEAVRTEAYQEIQRILLERGPAFIPYFFAQFMVASSAVSGVNLHPFAGRTTFNNAAV